MMSAQICGILGVLGLAVFVIGGKQDNDGQGTNPSIKQTWEKTDSVKSKIVVESAES